MSSTIVAHTSYSYLDVRRLQRRWAYQEIRRQHYHVHWVLRWECYRCPDVPGEGCTTVRSGAHRLRRPRLRTILDASRYVLSIYFLLLSTIPLPMATIDLWL